MDIKDLAIGNWVMSNGEPKQITGIYTHSCKNGYVQIKTIDCSAEYLEPILLTAKILEKNGFVRDGTSYILRSRTKWRLNNWFCLMNNSSPHNYKDKYRLIISGMLYKIEFVHQLQNALRLCEIEKEITL